LGCQASATPIDTKQRTKQQAKTPRIFMVFAPFLDHQIVLIVFLHA
jgi:hypothetical protein